jgi:putative acetyltransferase
VGDVTHIRDEQPSDVDGIRDVNRSAFGQEQEGRIVDALRANGAALLSLVAVGGENAERIVGHIMFSAARVGDVSGAALGPMAVAPEYQRQGIGARLVETGCERLARAGIPFIVVVGHPAFYPRFGFRPASAFGLTCEWSVPDEVFMALVLDAAAMRGRAGGAVFRPEFSTVS